MRLWSLESDTRTGSTLRLLVLWFLMHIMTIAPPSYLGTQMPEVHSGAANLSCKIKNLTGFNTR